VKLIILSTSLGRPPSRATDIWGASLYSAGHGIEPARTYESSLEMYAVNIEAVAKLAQLYAAGAPPDEEFRLIKERLSAVCNEQLDKQKGAHLTPAELRTAHEIRSRGVACDPYSANNAFGQRTETIQDESDFSAEVRAQGSSIRVAPRPSGLKDRFVSARALMRERISEVAFFSFAAAVALIFFWHPREAREIVSRWTLSMDRSFSVSTSNSSPALATSSEPLRRATVPPEVATARDSDPDHFSAQQEHISENGATTRGIKQHTRSKTSSPTAHSQENRVPMPVPETRWNTVEGWMLREVNNDAAVLEGPNGILTARRGDTVPGVGRVESIVRWGERWIVATSRGLISTP
jgi:hypothetical protein